MEQIASPVAIAGRWIAPASTQAIASSQHVNVVDPPAVSPLGRCTSSNAFACSCTHPACMAALPGTRELDAYLRRRWSFLRAGGTYCCRQNSATTSVPRLSVHSLGRAIDLMVPMDRGDADNTLGDQVANWLVENAEYVGVQRVVWDRSYWNGERGFGPLGSGSLSHTDHIHVELSVDGAARRTTFFTSGASAGAGCTARCEGTRAVLADCSAVECAATGATCVTAPVRCGPPLPAEPRESARVPNAPRPTLRALTDPLRLNLLAPSRRFDTRTPAESARLVRGGATGPLAGGATANLRDWSGAGLPAGARAVWMNLTAVSTEAGFVTAWPEGDPRPETSSLNYGASDVRANAAVIALGRGDGVSLAALNDVHLIGDLSAGFAPAGSALTLVAPARVYDTRSASMPLRGNEIREVDARAPAGATGVLGTVTAVSRDAPGFLKVFACGATPPTSSVVNFSASAVASNAFASSLGGGRLCVQSLAPTDVIIDVTGYLSPTGALAYRAMAPQRLLDTRGTATPYTGRLAARQVIELPLQSLPGAPANLGAATLNVVALGATEPGFLSVFPCGGAVPATSSLNFTADGARSTLVNAGLGGGAVCVFSSARAHLVVDLLGVWVPTSAGPTTPVPPMPDPGDDGDDMPIAGDAGVVIDAGVTPDAPTDVAALAQDVVDAPVAQRDAAIEADDLGGEVVDERGCTCRAGASTGASRRGARWLAALLALGALRRRRDRVRCGDA